MIGALSSAARNPWFAPLQTVREPRATLVCFPHGGGSAAAFRGWLAHMPRDIQLLAVELPGRGARFGELLQTEVVPLVEALRGQRTYLSAQAPLVFFGHSLGAMLAFELATAFERTGSVLVQHVVVSGRGAPHLPLRDAAVHALPDARFIEEVRRFQGLPDEVLAHPELMEIVLPILRADFRLSETYRRDVGQPLRCDLTVLGGRDDPMVDANALQEWRAHAASAFTLQTFQGGHFYLEQHLADIVALALQPLADRQPVGIARQG